jgi:hypothetical protein
MRHQRLRVELRLDGELKARYQGDYVDIAECGMSVLAAQPKVAKPVRKDHNAGGKSSWMQGFFDRPSPQLWQSVAEPSNRHESGAVLRNQVSVSRPDRCSSASETALKKTRRYFSLGPGSLSTAPAFFAS